MATSEERRKILKMVQEGSLTPEDAARLIAAMERPRHHLPIPPVEHVPHKIGRWFRVRVTDISTGKTRVNVQLPISLINAGIKMGARFSPEVEGLDLDQIKHIIDSGEMGKIVDVFNEQAAEHVEVFIE